MCIYIVYINVAPDLSLIHAGPGHRSASAT